MKHSIKSNTVNGPIVYCPTTKDTATGTYTSSGYICLQCNQHISNNDGTR